jgi:GNAT superfamily N-acetyltransferase
MNIIVKPLSRSRLKEASLLGAKVFPNHAKEIRAAYERSLDPEKKYLEERRLLQYYMAVDLDTNKIVALTGLYNRREYEEGEVWLGWFCADPEIRGQGIGRRTLEWTMNKARELGYKKFRLYTSTDPNEAVAQHLYESVGLQIYKRESNKDYPDEEILYREVNL